MIKYVSLYNPDDRIIKEASTMLLNNKLIACPTDTNYSIFCATSSKEGIQQLKRLKGGSSLFTFTLFCKTISQINDYAQLDNMRFKIIKQHTPGPFVFILPPLHSTARKINMKRSEIGVRICGYELIQNLITMVDAPLFGITAAKEMANFHWWDDVFADENLFQFGWELEEIPEISMIIDYVEGIEHTKTLSTVVNLTHEDPEILRQGKGVFNY